MKFTLKAKAHSGYRKASTTDRDADERWVREAGTRHFCRELTLVSFRPGDGE